MKARFLLLLIAAICSVLSISISHVFADEVKPVTKITEGVWTSNYAAPSGSRYGWQWDTNIWIDVNVENLAYEKSIGINWTTDGWATTNVTEGTFRETLPDGRERWTIAVRPIIRMKDCYWCQDYETKFEYAIFYRFGDQTYWENNSGQNYQLTLTNDHQKTEKLYPSPVNRLKDGIWSDEITGPEAPTKKYQNNPDGTISIVKVGSQELSTWNLNYWVEIAVEDLGPDKVVGIVWTTDQWKTTQKTYANYRDRLRSNLEIWRAELKPIYAFTNCVSCQTKYMDFEYAIFYEVNGKTFWDSNPQNESRNYAYTFSNEDGPNITCLECKRLR